MKIERGLAATNRQWVYFSIVILVIAGLYIMYLLNMVWWRSSPDFGWRTSYNYGPNIVADAYARGEAAGLRSGDTIVAINGKKYSTFDELYFKIRDDKPGSINTYTVERDGKKIDISIATGRLGSKAVFWRSGSYYVAGLIYIVIGTLVFLMKPKAKESWLFFVFTCFMGMLISYFSPSDLMRPLGLFRIRSFFECVISAPMIHLALIFPKTRNFMKKAPWLWVIAYLPPVIFFIFATVVSAAYWSIPPILDLLVVVYLMLGTLFFLISMVWNSIKDPSALVRLQSQMIVAGIIIAFFIPSAELLYRSIWKTRLFAHSSLMFTVLLYAFPLSIGYTIVRLDLFSIDTIVRRTYGYILTTGTLAGIYGLLVLISNLVFGGLGLASSPALPFFFVLIVVFLFNPIRDRIQKLIDRIFYRLEYDYQEIVQNISETMRSILNIDEIAIKLTQFALEPMFVDSGTVLMLDRDKDEYICLRHSGEKEDRSENKDDQKDASHGKIIPNFQNLTFPTDDPFIEKIAEKKKEITIYDIQNDPIFESQRDDCEKTLNQLGATLVVPLIYENQLTGMLCLGQKKSGKFYRQEDINLLNILANQGAVAIENALMVEEVVEKERMEEELSIARDLQVSMLPSECPTIEGFDIAAFSVSAREVGGDFYDFIDMGEEKAGIIVGDVTGKSVSGALVMSASRTLFRTLSEEEMGVSESMMRANRRLKGDVKTGMFVALLYAVLNSRDKTLTLCSAGQTQPVLMSVGTDEAILVETQGDTFPLGILDEANYEETRLQLQPGDKIVLYTDGIVEAMNSENELFGFERLTEVIKTSQAETAKSMLDEILTSVQNFSGDAPQHDDLTVIVVDVAK